MKAYLPSIYQRICKLKRRTKIFWIAAVAALLWFGFCLPDPLFQSPTSYVIEDAQGELLGATIAADGQWRFPYNENVPEKFKQCIISFEDNRFNYHPGIDPLAVLRAIKQNIQSAQTVSGGSTITMQVIRLSRNKNRNIFQKLIESILAVRLEIARSKKSILALYASHAPFGSNVVGLDAAAWRYYGRGPDKLSWGETAALAVLPNAPSLVHPGKNRESLLKKRNRLLDKLQEEKKIDSTTCLLAKLEPLPEAPKPLPQLAPHLLQRFKQEAAPGTYTRVQTTINRNLQNTVTQIVEQHHRFLKRNGINNACALVLDVATGKTLAYVGNVYHPEYPELQSSVDIITSRRSPGSALKPILYAGMLTEGLLLPHTLVPDIPTQIGGYTPQNFDRDYDGAVPASIALSRSLNVPAVRMLRDYKYPRFYDLLKKTGITTLSEPADHYGLSLILGGCEVTPWDMAGLYAGMARALNHAKKNKGKVLTKDFHTPYYLSGTTQSTNQQINRFELSAVSRRPIQGQIANHNKLTNHQPTNQSTLNLIDPVSIWYMFQAMEEVMRPGEEGLWKQFSSAQRVAWKTGTSFGFRDAWAIGVTPRFVIAVWAGNGSGEGRPGLIGVQAAAPMLFDIVRALPAAPWFAEPSFQYNNIAVCRQTGFRANTDCADVDTIKASPHAVSAPLCPYHTIIQLSADQQYRVTENCAAPSSMVHKSWLVLPPAMEWYYKRKHFDYLPMPPYKQGCAVWEARKPMALIYPEPDAKIYVPLEITGQKGRTVFTAAHQKPAAKIFWHLDDVYIGTTVHTHQMALDPKPGTHFITIVDETGERITRRFIILEKDE